MASHWAADGGKRYLAAYKQSLAETVQMLKVALVHRPSNLRTEKDSVAKYIDYAKRNVRKREAKIISSAKERAIVLHESGEYFSIPTGPTFESADMAERRPQSGHGRVFVYQPSGLGGFDSSIYLDGKNRGTIGTGTFLLFELEPGEHVFSLKYEGDLPGASVAKMKIGNVNPVSVQVSAGQTYYVEFDGYGGIFTSSDAMRLTDAADASEKIQPLWWARR